jgi:hypothetical protein
MDSVYKRPGRAEDKHLDAEAMTRRALDVLASQRNDAYTIASRNCVSPGSRINI